MRRIAPLLLLLCLLAGCADQEDALGVQGDEPVKLIYYTIGSPDQDLRLVNDALNELLLERYGFTVEYHKIDWNYYTDRLNGIMNTDQDFDVAFAWSDNYITNAKRNIFMDLTGYLQGEGRQLYETVAPLFWEGAAIDGQIFGVPTNKELATQLQFLFSEELVEKYDIDVTEYRTLASLEPVLEMIAREEPDCIPLFFDSSRIDLMAIDGYEYLASNAIPLMIDSRDPQPQIVNIYETEEVKPVLSALHRYYQAGYINQDAPLRTSFSRFEDEQVFCRLAIGGPESSASFSIDYGYPILAVPVSQPIATTISVQGGIMTVNAKTHHREEELTFLRAVNTDPDVRNLLNYGIEGIHYQLTEEGQVELISQAYRGIPYTQGNWFILRTMVGESPDKWEQYRRFNDSAAASPLLGFVPDFSQCQELYNEVSKVYQKYDNALMTGSADPEVYLSQLLEELDQAGIRELIEILQVQVDTWLAEKAAP